MVVSLNSRLESNKEEEEEEDYPHRGIALPTGQPETEFMSNGTPVERTWHIYGSRGQILALTLR